MDIVNRVDGAFPSCAHHMAQQGIEVLGCADWAQADVFVVSDLRKDKLRDKIHWRTTLAGCWSLSMAATMDGQGIFVKYKPALHKVARNYEHELNKLAMLSLGSAGGPT